MRVRVQTHRSLRVPNRTTNRPRTIAPNRIHRKRVAPSRTDQKLIDLIRIGPKRIGLHNRRLATTVRLTPNPTIGLMSRLRIIDPSQTVPSRTDRKLIGLSRVGPK